MPRSHQSKTRRGERPPRALLYVGSWLILFSLDRPEWRNVPSKYHAERIH
jgi:hypothetical protein